MWMRLDVRWNMLADLKVSQLSINCLEPPPGEVWRLLSKPKELDTKEEEDLLERARLSKEQLDFWGKLSSQL